MIPEGLIDTLTIKVKKDSVLLPSLEIRKETKDKWGTSVESNYRNLWIKEKNDLVTISGSLTKFLKYENVSNLSFSECKEAALKLCNEFSIEPRDATIKRVDFGKTVKMDFNPQDYYPFLGNHNRYLRNPHKGTLYYQNKTETKCLSFYDKGKKERIPGNLLRYEKRFFRPDLFIKKELFLVDLLTEEVYNRFLSSWKEDYQKIEKQKMFMPMSTKQTSKSYMDLLLAEATNDKRDSIFKKLKIDQRTGILSKQEALRVRKKLNGLYKSDLFQPYDIINELDSKIQF